MPYVIMVRKKTKTEALELDVVDALNVVKARMARRREYANLGRLPTYSDAIRELLRRSGF